MTVHPDLLAVLCCPISKTPVKVMGPEQLSALNNGVQKGIVKYQDDSPVEKPLQTALVTEDNKMAYAVDGNIPIMLPEKGIALSQLG